ncbi:desulfoferrodoxin family protein [Thermodesulfobacteriota bacterium]
MDRRAFVELAMLGGAATLFAPKLVSASSGDSALKSNMAGGVYYTKEAPGRWSKKVAGHEPKIEKKAGSDGKTEIIVTTAHGMKAWEHYIVKHMLLDKDFNFIAEKMFDPTKDKKPVSTFKLDKYKGPLYALSMCNKHDCWVAVITV